MDHANSISPGRELIALDPADKNAKSSAGTPQEADLDLIKSNVDTLSRKVNGLYDNWQIVRSHIYGINERIDVMGKPLLDMVPKVENLQKNYEELQWKLLISKAFIKAFTLPKEIMQDLLCEDGVIGPKFFEAKNFLQETLERCETLLAIEDSECNLGTELVESLLYVRKKALMQMYIHIPKQAFMLAVPFVATDQVKQVVHEFLDGQNVTFNASFRVIIWTRSSAIFKKIESIIDNRDTEPQRTLNFGFLAKKTMISLADQLSVEGLENAFQEFPEIYKCEANAWDDIFLEEDKENVPEGVIPDIFSETIYKMKKILYDNKIMRMGKEIICPELLFRLCRSIKLCEYLLKTESQNLSDNIVDELQTLYNTTNLSFNTHLSEFVKSLGHCEVSPNNGPFIPSKNVQKLISLTLYLCTYATGIKPPEKFNAWLLKHTAETLLDMIESIAANECENLQPIYKYIYLVNCSSQVLSSLRKMISPDMDFEFVSSRISLHASGVAREMVKDALSTQELPMSVNNFLNNYYNTISLEESDSKISKGLLSSYSYTIIGCISQGMLSPLKLISSESDYEITKNAVIEVIFKIHSELYSALNEPSDTNPKEFEKLIREKITLNQIY